MLAALARAGWAGDAAALDSTHVQAHRSAHGGNGGATAQAIGLSRGGQTTKIHALTNVLGRPGVPLLTSSNTSYVTTAPTVLAEAPGRIQRLAANKGYDADWLHADLRKSGIALVIPGKRGRKRRICHDRHRFRERWRIEATFNRLEDFRRIANRYDKLARNYASALAPSIAARNHGLVQFPARAPEGEVKRAEPIPKRRPNEPETCGVDRRDPCLPGWEISSNSTCSLVW